MRPLAQLCRRVGMSLRAGVDARSVWAQEARRGSPGQQMRLARISDRVAAGDSVAEAMRDSQGYFPLLTCELVDVGERTGRADEAFLQLADHYDHLVRMRRLLLAGVAWPMIELAVAIFVVGLLIWFGGEIAPLRGGQPIDLLGFGLLGTRGLLIYVLIVSGLAFVIGVPAVAVVQGRVSPRSMRWAMQIPGIGRWLRTAALERLARSLAMALDAGVDARRSIQLALRSTQNPHYTAHLEDVDRVVMQGGEFHEALRKTGAFPDEFLDALETAEVAGTQSESMTRLAADYQERSKAAAQVLTVAAAVIIFALVAAILIGLIFRLAMFYIGAIYDAMSPI